MGHFSLTTFCPGKDYYKYLVQHLTEQSDLILFMCVDVFFIILMCYEPGDQHSHFQDENALCFAVEFG